MRSRIFLSVFIFSLFLSNTLYGQINRVDTILFSTQTGLLVLKGLLNDKEAFFAFDTGAGLGVLNSEHVASSQIEGKGKKAVRDSNNDSKSMRKGKIDVLTIGSFSFKNVESVIYDMPFLVCNKLYLLGGDIINQLNWKFDFEKNMAYVSKAPFKPNTEMTELNIQIVNNRHFADFDVMGSPFRKCLIDFGYSGTLEVSQNETIFIKLKKEKEDKMQTITSKSTSIGLSSISIGQDMSTFFIDSLKAGNALFKDIKVNVKEKTDKKIGLKFFSQNVSTIILNNNDTKYWLQSIKKPIDNNLGFDADVYLNNGKLEVIGKNLGEKSTTKSLIIGEEIKSIDSRTASSFKDICEFMAWRLEKSKKQEFLVEKLNGEKIIVKRTTF